MHGPVKVRAEAGTVPGRAGQPRRGHLLREGLLRLLEEQPLLRTGAQFNRHFKDFPKAVPNHCNHVWIFENCLHLKLHSTEVVQ